MLLPPTPPVRFGGGPARCTPARAGARSGWLRSAAGGWCLLIASAMPLSAQPLTEPDRPGDEQPATAATSDQPAQQEREPSVATSLPPWLADPGGVRVSLESAGISYSLTYIAEVLGNVSGGQRRGAAYQGRLDLQVEADLEKLANIPGLTLHGNAYQIHGRGLSSCCLGNILTTSGIEASPSTRLFELWAEQKLFGDKLAVRVGQLAADTEFLVSEYGSLFVNATFGWPAITGANLPSGGPAYPLATPGVRVKVTPIEQLSLMTAVFNGDPSGARGDEDPQRRNRSGTNFRTRDPVLLVAEAAFAYFQGKDAAWLPGTVKLGGYYHFGRFDDQRFDTDGVSLADPGSSGLARRFQGNSGIYGVVDQLVYRVPGTTDRGIGVFARASGSPSDRNLVSFYVDGGVSLKGMLPGRPDDTFGIGAGYAQVSARARDLDRDARAFGTAAGTDTTTGIYAGPSFPVRSSETVLEVTYQAQVVPGFTIQPDFQYVFRPGANVSNPRDLSGAAVKDAAIFGLRATIRY